MDLDGGNGMSFSEQQTEEMDNSHQMDVGRNVLEELKAERNALDPSFVHCVRLLDNEIKTNPSSGDSNVKQAEKIYVSLQEQRKYNLIGRLLGPKGMTLKRIQNDTQTKMSILGRTSMKDKQKEEELRNSDDPAHQHLKDDLHVLIEANPPFSTQKLLAGIADVRKMLIPPEPGQPDFSTKFDHPPPGQLLPPPPSLMRNPHMMGGGRGRMGGGRGGGRGGKPGYGGGGGGRGRRGGSGGGGRGRGGGGGGRGGRGGGQMNDSRSESSAGRFGGPPGGGRDQPPSMDSWRDTAISKDYNHGATGGASTDYGGGRGSANDSFSSSEPYYSSFSDQGGGGSGSSGVGYGTGATGGGGGNGRPGDWKTQQRMANRRDNRPHPYGGGGGAGAEGYFYW